MVMVLSVILLAVMGALIYMITVRTQFSGMQKRYNTALEAGKGGSDLIFQTIGYRGDNTSTDSFLSGLGFNSSRQTPAGCTGTSMTGTVYTGLAAKLNTSSKKSDGTANWSSGCNTSLSIKPTDATTYDFKFDFGANALLGIKPTYTVYAKIVDAVEGNSNVDIGLRGGGTTSPGGQQVMSIPYLYTIELDSENPANPNERAKLSILYQY